MSMIGNYLRIPEADLNRVVKDLASITALLYPEDGSDLPADRHLDTDKAWHLIHFLLTGDAWAGEGPLRNAVLGGTEIGEKDVGYGPARYLTPAQVRETSAALTPISSQELWSRFDRQAAEDADIYPAGWVGAEEDRDYIVGNFETLKEFFVQAAQANDAVILYLN
jgi:hypothetical protein